MASSNRRRCTTRRQPAAAACLLLDLQVALSQYRRVIHCIRTNETPAKRRAGATPTKTRRTTILQDAQGVALYRSRNGNNVHIQDRNQQQGRRTFSAARSSLRLQIVYPRRGGGCERDGGGQATGRDSSHGKDDKREEDLCGTVVKRTATLTVVMGHKREHTALVLCGQVSHIGGVRVPRVPHTRRTC